MSTYLALIVMAYATNRFGKTYGIDSLLPGPGRGAMPLVFCPARLDKLCLRTMRFLRAFQSHSPH